MMNNKQFALNAKILIILKQLLSMENHKKKEFLVKIKILISKIKIKL